MSISEKIIVVLFDCGFDRKDFSKESGFIDIYTIDPDFPCGDHALYFAYDSNTHTEQSITTHRKFSTNPYVIKTYTKIVEKTPYCIYKLYIPPTLFKRVELGLYVDDDLKLKLLDFWKDDSEIRHFVFNSHTVHQDWFKLVPEETDTSLYLESRKLAEEMWLNSITVEKQKKVDVS